MVDSGDIHDGNGLVDVCFFQSIGFWAEGFDRQIHGSEGQCLE